MALIGIPDETVVRDEFSGSTYEVSVEPPYGSRDVTVVLANRWGGDYKDKYEISLAREEVLWLIRDLANALSRHA